MSECAEVGPAVRTMSRATWEMDECRVPLSQPAAAATTAQTGTSLVRPCARLNQVVGQKRVFSPRATVPALSLLSLCLIRIRRIRVLIHGSHVPLAGVIQSPSPHLPISGEPVRDLSPAACMTVERDAHPAPPLVSPFAPAVNYFDVFQMREVVNKEPKIPFPSLRCRPLPALVRLWIRLVGAHVTRCLSERSHSALFLPLLLIQTMTRNPAAHIWKQERRRCRTA